MDIVEVSKGLSENDLLNIRVFKDGDTWCALRGKDLQEGVGGFGSTVFNAIHNLAKNIKYNEHLDCASYDECLTIKNCQRDPVILDDYFCFECTEYLRR